MKLQKQLSRRVKDIDYPKYVLTVPPKEIEKLGWEPGKELKVEVKDGKLIISPSQK